MSPQSIRTYLAVIRHTQVTLGLPEPCSFSSLPRLHLVQAGIQRAHLEQSAELTRIRLSITPAILRAMQSTLEPRATEPDVVMIWAAAVLCFFGFFRSSEITTPNAAGFNPKIHLAWGDVAIDSAQSPTLQPTWHSEELEGSVFPVCRWIPSDQGQVHRPNQRDPPGNGVPTQPFCGSQPPYRSSNSSCQGRPAGFHNSHPW